MIFGSIILHAERAVPQVDLPALHGLPTRMGQHVKGRYNGLWTEVSDLPQTEIYLPQRYKRLTVTSTGDTTDLVRKLEQLDSQYVDTRQLYKLNQLLDSMNTDFAAVVNISSAETEGNPVSGAFYLLAKGIKIYVALVFDTAESSVQLMWSTEDFKTSMQQRGLQRYVFYPMPLLIDRPLFVHTQNLCARWWKLSKTFGTNVLTSCNALELRLYKDPDVKTYELYLRK